MLLRALDRLAPLPVRSEQYCQTTWTKSQPIRLTIPCVSETLSALQRCRECLLGGAVGDALGAPVEFMSIGQIHSRFGPDGIRYFAPAYGRIGAITDDTQMALVTAEALIRAAVREAGRGACHIPTVVHRAYVAVGADTGLRCTEAGMQNPHE